MATVDATRSVVGRFDERISDRVLKPRKAAAQVKRPW